MGAALLKLLIKMLLLLLLLLLLPLLLVWGSLLRRWLVPLPQERLGELLLQQRLLFTLLLRVNFGPHSGGLKLLLQLLPHLLQLLFTQNQRGSCTTMPFPVAARHQNDTRREHQSNKSLTR